MRGYKGIKEATVNINKYTIKVAVVQQMENLETILKDNYYKKFHFIEVMNCKGGCIGGGGNLYVLFQNLMKWELKELKGYTK